MSEWQESTLKDLIEFIVDNRGKTPSLSDIGIELLEVNSVCAGRKTPDYSKVRKFVSIETYDSWFRKGHPLPNDILIPTVGTIGNVAFIKEARGAIAQNLIALRLKKSICSEYVYYFFSSSLGHDLLLSLDIGGVQPSIKVPHLLDLALPIPPLSEQRAIAAVLSSLDDKIDLLHRQNKTLEAMAETLFRQWFVEEAGEDWEEGTLGDLVEFNYGKTLKENERTGHGFPVYGSGSIVGYHDKALVNAPGIITGRKGTLGVVTYSFYDFYPIDTTFYITSKLNSKGMFFEYFLLKQAGLGEMNTDSAVPGLNRSIAHAIPINIPEKEKINQFNKDVASWFKKLKANTEQIQTLEKMRDSLLPKLMSGEVRVKFEDAA